MPTLDRTEVGWLKEIKAAERERDKKMQRLDDMLRNYFTSSFDAAAGLVNPGNPAFEFASQIIPQMVFNNPSWLVSSNQSWFQEEKAVAMQAALNRWTDETDLAGAAELAAYDQIFIGGILHTFMEEHPTYKIPSGGEQEGGKAARWPFTERISPRRFGRDPMAESWDQALYFFHTYDTSKDELLGQAEQDPDGGWLVDQIKQIPETSKSGLDGDAAGFGPRSAMSGRPEEENPDRKIITVYRVWDRKHVLEESEGPDAGFHGTYWEIARGQSGDKGYMVRKPQPAFCPEWGPYAPCETFVVMDSVYGLAPLQVAFDQIEALAAQQRANDKSQRRHKRFVACKSGQTAEDINNIEADQVAVDARGELTDIEEIEVGGVTDQGLRQEMVRRGDVDNVLGMHAAKRGIVTGEGTATEVAEASGASDIRTDYIIKKNHDGVSLAGKTALWHMWVSSDFLIPIGSGAEEALQSDEPIAWQGGERPEEFKALELRIEPMSMGRTTEGMRQARVMQAIEVLPGIAQTVTQFPFVKGRKLCRMYGDAFNLPGFEEVIDWDLAQEWAQMMLGMQMAGGVPSGDQGRLSIHRPEWGNRMASPAQKLIGQTLQDPRRGFEVGVETLGANAG